MPYKDKNKRREARKIWYQQYKIRQQEKGRSQSKDYYEKNKDKIKIKKFKYSLFRNFGITYEQYIDMYTKQDGKCKICGIPESENRSGKKKLSVDHCHDTGKVRGLLCDSCNNGLGLFKDNKDLLMSAVNYLSVLMPN